MKGHPPLPKSGRPRGPTVATMLREILDEDGPEIFKARVRKILTSGEKDSDSVKVMELFRKTLDGDKLSVAEVESHDWIVDPDAEVADPVPAALPTNRLSQRGEE